MMNPPLDHHARPGPKPRLASANRTSKDEDLWSQVKQVLSYSFSPHGGKQPTVLVRPQWQRTASPWPYPSTLRAARLRRSVKELIGYRSYRKSPAFPAYQRLYVVAGTRRPKARE